MKSAAWAVGAGLGYGAAILFVPEAALNFSRGSVVWGWFAVFQAVALVGVATAFARIAWQLYRSGE
ncbi:MULTISPECIES: hypothetical protein [Deinococcus]|uniref:Uncharacterized protein n=1 Tax=Deinococcus rufus TaxID=2136097 RepID=A0ABV7ZET3_9DEIO|nr:hypothetical protein [Deinococcus sp. AB2017081]WQE94030.1 hypothetical protein U2P90_11485 [Deinococcus sp. AB2017081]